MAEKQVQKGTCKACSGKLTTKGIACDACNFWFCYSCLGITKELFDAVQKFTGEHDAAHIFISCKTCMMTLMPVAAIKKGASIEAKLMSDKMEAINVNIEEKLKQNLDSLHKLEQKFDDSYNIGLAEIKEKVDKSLKDIETNTTENTLRWADIVRRSDVSDAKMDKVNIAVNNSAKVHSNFEERERSMLIFKLKENDKATAADRYNEDLSYVNKFIAEGLHLPVQSIQSVFRVGFYDAAKSRPLKVIFTYKSSLMLVMNNLSSLSRAELCYKNVSISVDRSKEEQALFKAKMEEAKTLTENSDKVYFVRGTYTPVIVEKRNQ